MTLKYTKQKNQNQFLLKLLTKIKKNHIVGCIYKHLKMLTHEFNDTITPILEKVSLENKEGYVMGDFNINLMNYETDNPTSHFLDNICSNSFFPYINIPTRHTSQLLQTIYFAQFLITSYQVHSETKPKKILTRTFKSFA